MDALSGINWTTILASAVTASIIGGSQFVFNRYLARILDRIEKEMTKNDKDRLNGTKKDSGAKETDTQKDIGTGK